MMPRASAEAGATPFDRGFAAYMASNCAGALDELYLATLSENKFQDRARLYLAHCQSLLGQPDSAAFHLDKIETKNLLPADVPLFKDLKAKHATQIAVLHKLYFNVSPYVGISNTSPDTVKGTSQFYGLSLGVSRPTWSVSAFYEGYSLDMVPKTYKDYTQTMFGAQGGYFIVPIWRLSASFTTINASTDQLKGVTIAGLQTDIYFRPAWSLFIEGYSSSYPKLLANAAGVYKYEVSARQVVAGLRFPVVNTETAGLNGALSVGSVSVAKPSDAAAVSPKGLRNASRFEGLLSTFYKAASASVTAWSGAEVLGVRGRGTTVYNSTDKHKSGVKLGLGYAFNSYFSVGAGYGVETYESTDTTGATKDFNSSTATLSGSINW